MALPILLRGNHQIEEPLPQTKSVIFDIATNHGDALYMGIRQVDFFRSDGTRFDLTASDITCYATSTFSDSFLPSNAFNTSLPTGGANSGNEWVSYSGGTTNQRLICVFNTPIDIALITINNSHNNGSNITRGFNAVKVYLSSDTITDTTYNASISNSSLIFNGTLAQHPSDAYQYDVIIYGSTTKKRNIIIDCVTNWGGTFTGLRSVELTIGGTVISRTSRFVARATSETFVASQAFNTSLSKTGDDNATSWLATGAGSSRISCQLFDFINFDGVTINNIHESGTKTNYGAKAIKIYTGYNYASGSEAVTYNASVPSGHVKIFDGTLAAHVASNAADDQILSVNMSGI